MNTNRRSAQFLLIAFALFAGACSQAPKNEVTPPPTQATVNAESCKPDSAWPAAPTTEQLTSMMYRALDPNVPLSDKIPYVQGAEGDPELLNRLGKKAKESHFSAKILNIADNCNGTAAAATLATFGEKTNAVEVPLVAEDGGWKLNKEWMCGLMNDYQLTSNICP